MHEMEALAVRCEQASGPDRELDGAIARAMLGWTKGSRSGYFYAPGDKWSRLRKPLSYTSSLDAAMTLVPDGWSRGQWSEIGKKDSARLWRDEHDIIVAAATPALALCAAALRAAAEKQP